MMRVSTHFIRSEFACKCGCGFDAVDVTLIFTLEAVRKHFNDKYPGKNISIQITSGCRCSIHNAKEGGAKRSQHVFGKAADFKVTNVSPRQVYDYMCEEYSEWFGIGLYSNRVHVDVRTTPARWINE